MTFSQSAQFLHFYYALLVRFRGIVVEVLVQVRGRVGENVQYGLGVNAVK